MAQMNALVVPAAGRLQLQAVPVPVIGPYQALVKIEVCGICNSTDHKLIEGTMGWAPPFPFVLGHESVGEIVEVGAKVTKYKVGDRVTRPIYQAPRNGGLNAAMGGFAQFGIVTDEIAMAADGDTSLLTDYNALRQIVVPKDISPLEAALCISLSETSSVLRHLPNPRGQHIVVAGTGIAGLAFILWSKLAGAHVTALGRRPERLHHAKQIGADVVIDTKEIDYLQQIEKIASGPVDGLLEATGDASLADQLLHILKPDGFAVAYGVPPVGTNYHQRWQTAIVEEHLSFGWVTDLIRRGWIRSEWFSSHLWTFDESIAAFNAVQNGEVSKGFITFANAESMNQL